ncbi:MAG: cytochrome b N-terminal domain-containing protein [Deinococcus sp.]|nr:cytochrome b N-terminal domain-containing protein [Deinococcus sp.]
MSRTLPGRIWRSIYRQPFADEEREGARVINDSLLMHLHPVKLRRHGLSITYTFGLGGISFLLFIVLTVTGVLLMFQYLPTTEQAYADIQRLSGEVFLGQLLRNMHRWAAHAMVLAVFLHMCRAFFTGSYKPPRSFNWAVGVGLLVLTLLLSFTGYLLPWDQLAFWAITVGTNIAGYAPLVGRALRSFLLDGIVVGQGALLRFYVLHVVVLPLVLALLVGLHFWRVRKDGGISGPPLPGGGHE